MSYILVTDSEDDDAECLILKDTSGENQSESIYEIVEDIPEEAIATTEQTLRRFMENISASIDKS